MSKCRKQWNLYITDTIGEQGFGRYREVSVVERFAHMYASWANSCF